MKRSPKIRKPGRLKSMRVSEGFRTYALDQLSSVEGVRARPMFGGFGLYVDDVFFGILAGDVLYLKVDDSNREEYESAKAEPFQPFENRPMSMSYYSVPLSVLESASVLRRWARRAIAVAQAASKKKKK